MDSSLSNDCEEEYLPDPNLEKLREKGLSNEQLNYEKLASDLKNKVGAIHCAYLFHPKSREALRSICICFSSTPTSIYYKSWKDLAGFLGLSFSLIGCIENCKEDFTEMVLKTYSQKSDSSLGQLVSAFEKIKRYDALNIANDMFPDIAEIIKKEQVQNETTDCQMNTINEDDLPVDVNKLKLEVPDYFYEIARMLPITLRDPIHQIEHDSKKLLIKEINSFDSLISRHDLLQNSSVVPPPRLHRHVKRSLYGKKVMLTFASDSIELAKLVAVEFRKVRDNAARSGVLILSEHPDKVEQNPERFITHQFAKMDYIIPILSERYVHCLCNPTRRSDTNLLDELYIKLIHDHMSKYYTNNNCMNDKFRCVIPKNCMEKILDHPHVKIDPTLRVYISDDIEDIEKLVVRLANAKRIQ